MVDTWTKIYTMLPCHAQHFQLQFFVINDFTVSLTQYFLSQSYRTNSLLRNQKNLLPHTLLRSPISHSCTAQR